MVTKVGRWEPGALCPGTHIVGATPAGLRREQVVDVDPFDEPAGVRDAEPRVIHLHADPAEDRVVLGERGNVGIDSLRR